MKKILIGVIITYRLIPAPVRSLWKLGGTPGSAAALAAVRRAPSGREALRLFIRASIPRMTPGKDWWAV